jgi:NADH-quinone oxidoreductase subunit C/D
MSADGLAPKPDNGGQHDIVRELYARFGESGFVFQQTVDHLPTLWVVQSQIGDVLRYLKNGVPRPYKMLYDLTAVDERLRKNRQGLPPKSR